MGFDVCSLPEEDVYDFYRTYKYIENTINKKLFISSEDNLDLENCRLALLAIENYAMGKRSLRNDFSPVNLFTNIGNNTILTLRFYPGSKSYKKFGESILVNIQFTQRDVGNIIKCLVNNTPKTAGTVKFKFALGSAYEKLCSTDIYSIHLFDESILYLN